MAEWPVVPLGDVVTLINGDRGKNYPRAEDRVQVGVPFINAGHLAEGRVRLRDMDYITPVHHQVLRSGHVEAGDVLLCIRGSLGRAAVATPNNVPSAIASSLVILRPTAQILSRFLLAYLEGPVGSHLIASADNGAAQPNIGASAVAQFGVPLPPISTQRKIAAVLAAYDELIENNLRRIEILEEMAQAVYREWFVNFRYPGHENVPLVDSPLGPIPDEWEMRRLDEVAALHRGRSYRTANLVDDGGWPFLNLKCIDRDGGFRRSGLKRYDGPIKPHQLARTGDVVVALTDMTQERRIVARAARVPKLNESEAVMSMDLLRVEPVDRNDKSFVYGTLRFSSFPDQVKQYANGANVLHLSPDRIAEFELPIPPRELRQRFAEVAEPLVELSDNLELQNANLRATRDLLLPRLVSGELDVSELDIDTEWLAS